MSHFRKQLVVTAAMLALLISTVPLHAPVSAEFSTDGWASHDSGITSALYGVRGNSPSDVFACGELGYIVHYDGSAWNAMTSGITSALYGLWCASPQSVFAVGNGGTILSYNGTDWNLMTSGTSSHLNGVWGSSSDNVFAVGNVGTILSYNGTSWNPMASGTTSHLRGIWGSSPTDVFAVGNGGVILHYDGLSWSPMTGGVKAKLYGVWGSAPDQVLAVGEGGTILEYDGASWTAVSINVTENLHGIWGTSADDLFVVGANGTILRYDGSTWNQMSSGTTSSLQCVWGSGSFDIYSVGNGGTILHYRENIPIITSVDPSQGCQGASLTTIIGGHNLAGATTVDFGAGVTVAGFDIDGSGTQITANITVDGSAAAGTRDVLVTTAEGSTTLPAGFTITIPSPAPTVTAVSPVSGNQGQTLGVVISGTNFIDGALVDFGSGITVSSVSVDSGTQISANITIDSGAAVGARNVSVTTDGGVDALASGFEVVAPTPPSPVITTVVPGTGVCGETLSVVISGSNFINATVDFGAGVLVTGFEIDSSGTQITANITIDSGAAVGARNVSVTTDGGVDALSSGFEVVAPTPPSPVITAVAPGTGVCGETLSVVISGSNFINATVDFGAGVLVTGFEIDSSGTQITANITIDAAAAPGTRNVSVTASGLTDTYESGFEVVAAPPPPPAAPNVTAVDPGAAVCGETLEVVISGSSLSGATAVDFGAGVTVTGFDIDSSGTQITANITIDAAAAPGTRNVSVTASGLTGTYESGFEVVAAPPPPPAAPNVAAVDPGAALCGETLEVVISGSSLSGATAVDFGSGVTVTGFEIDSAGTQITANIFVDADAAAGKRHVSVETAVGSAVLNSGFEVFIPFSDVTGVSPSAGMVGETLDVIVSGRKLDRVTSVDFGAGIKVNGFRVDSANQISVNVTIRADAKPGYRDVTITTPGNNYRHVEAFSVRPTPPSILLISQVEGRQGEQMVVTIEGTNLVGVTRIIFGPGIEVEGFDMYSPTAIRVSLSIAPDAEKGTRTVYVTAAPGGTCAMENAFTVKGSETFPLSWILIAGAASAFVLGIIVFVLRRFWVP